MKELNLADLMVKKSKQPVRVPTPEIAHGSVCYILNPTPDQSDLAQMQWKAFQANQGSEGKSVGFSKFLVMWALCDANNQQLIDVGDDETQIPAAFIEAVEVIGGPEGMDNVAHARLFDKAMQSFGLSKKDVEELEKELKKTPSGGGSGSKRKQSASAAKSGSANSKTSEK